MRTTQLIGLLKTPLLVLLAIANVDIMAFDGLMDNAKLKRVALKDDGDKLDIVIDTVNGPVKDGNLEIDKIQMIQTDQGQLYMIIGQMGFKALLEQQQFKEQFCKLTEMMAKNTDDIVTLGYVDETYEKDTFAILATKEGTYIVLDGGKVTDFQKLGDDRIIAKLADGTTSYVDNENAIAAFEKTDYEHIGAMTHLTEDEKFARVMKDDKCVAAFTRGNMLYFLDRDDASQLDGDPVDLQHPDMKNTSIFVNNGNVFIAGQVGAEDFIYKKFDGTIEQISA